MKGLLQEWVTAQADRRPEATAIVCGEERLNYLELDRQSSQLARLLKERGCRGGDRVALLLPKAPAAIVAMLGALKADAIYVPLDLQSPAARLRRVVESCECRWVLSDGPATPLLDEMFGAPFPFAVSVGWMSDVAGQGAHFRSEFSAEDFSSFPGEPPDYRSRPEDPAHILFTSGSTGSPKGVVIPHANVNHFVDWARSYFGIGPDDRNSGHSPMHFDLSTFDVYGTFAAGAELHMIPPDLNVVPQRLADIIRGAGLTQWFSVPSILSYMAKFDVVKFDDFPSLKRLLWCGEVFPTSALVYWMKRLPHVSFTNLYGPTEATIASSYYTVPRCPEDEQAPIPIGSPCAGEELLVLDGELEPTPPGEVGDLYIRGVGLSPGYWRDDAKTRAVFLPNPRGGDPEDRIYKTGDLARRGNDGLVYFIGRKDSQIKSRGYRIELGEIEAALHTLDGLEECAVVAIPSSGFEGSRICCAYVPMRGSEVDPISIKRELAKRIPGYMLPFGWKALERLPKNANGKIDRPKLIEGFLSGLFANAGDERENPAIAAAFRKTGTADGAALEQEV
jgi:amino acid adenylation domain-containing protein